jgi:hypothetical protein
VKGAAWDWYQATVERPEGAVKQGIIDAIGEAGEWRKLGDRERKVRQGYAVGYELVEHETGDVGRLHLYAGGVHEFPHLLATGQNAEFGARVIRAQFPEHKVARCDACYDFDVPGLFDEALFKIVGIARRKNMSPKSLGDWHVEKARTLRLGSEKSPVMMNMYEKGAQLLQDRGISAEMDISPNFVRFEVRLRPQSKIKSHVALMSPDDVWTASEWSREVRRECMGVDMPRYVMPKMWKDENQERAMRFLMIQYGKVLTRAKDREGSWAELGCALGRGIDELRRRT